LLNIYSEHREYVKDLTCISKDLCNIVIVDNNPYSFLLQPDNGIPCVPFSAGQPHDNQVHRFILLEIQIIHMIFYDYLLTIFFVFVMYVHQLLDVILPILKDLSDQKDVRHVLYEKYHMPEWFQQQGIPAPS